MSSSLLRIASGVIPSIAKHLNKKVVTKSIIDIAKDVTGLESLEDVANAITGNTDKLLAFQDKLREHELNLLKMANEDIKDARDMQKVALQQDDIFSKRYIYYLASAWSIFAMIYIPCITFCTVPEDSVRFADTILGFLLGTVIASILTFFFGSSHGSKDKTEALKGIIVKAK